MPASSIELVGFDIETTMRCKRDGHSSSTPWDTNNYVLCMVVKNTKGFESRWIHADSSTPSWFHFDDKIAYIDGPTETVLDSLKSPNILVGHNLKFDLQYIRHRFAPLYEQMIEMPVWDTSVAEYILSAQQHQYPSLADVALEYGVGVKSNTLTDAISKGGTTEDVPILSLLSYCSDDVQLTLDVAHAQMKRARERDPGLIDLILLHSSIVKVYAEIEGNGMRWSAERSLQSCEALALEITEQTSYLKGHVEANLTCVVGSTEEAASLVDKCFDSFIGSNQFWSSYFFGGDYTFTWKEQIGTYKTGPKKGEPRFAVHKRETRFPQYQTPSVFGSERTKTGDWKVDESVINNIALGGSESARLLLKLRKLRKLVETYLIPFGNLTWEGRLHPAINNTATNTGRISQSKPNLMNIANESHVKRCFVPFSDDLCFIEADYKQLEMVVFAFLVQDERLMCDLRAGYDIHAMIGREIFKSDYTEDKRRLVKGVVFGTIYGGGPVTLAKQSGVPQTEIKRIQDAFYRRYPTIRRYRQLMSEEISNQCKLGMFEMLESGGVYRLGSPTGRNYAIPVRSEVVPAGIHWVPAYTSMCNYPVQGLATGDIVPMMLYHIWNRIRKERKDISIVNTVHDSILFEVPKMLVYAYMDWIKRELERGPELLKKWFNIDFKLDLPVKVKYSKDSWDGPWVEWAPF